MFNADELRHIPLFESMPVDTLQKLTAKSADVRLCEGEWLIREGESPYFFVLLEGSVELVKDINGREEHMHRYHPGEFFGEVPILLGAPTLASVRALMRAGLCA